MKFSIITVTYNAEKTLGRTLKSVLSQSFADMEYIIIDGKSTDKTLEIIQRYNSHLSIFNFQFISEADKGLYDAMNKGAAMAKGDYLCFLNSGDAFHTENTVEELFHAIPEGTEPDILYGETDIVDGEGRFLYPRRLRAPEKLEWTSFKQGMLVCHQAFIVRRALFEPYNLSYRFSSDVDWCIRMMKKAEIIHNTGLTLINYLEEGMTTTNRKASLKERYRLMNTHYGKCSTFFHHLWFAIRAIGK
ncbi:MAG: glycosyltransferase [Dysgonamonadaceae bacterium]|jgi:glycosyltransferase involved in cell wall biosynthesis|nr:glycosyltransferase [Dysgonamonadaceae bacterium]